MPSITVTSKIFLAIYVGQSTLTLNTTNAPWLSNVIKIIRPSLNSGLNTRQAYNGAYGGVSPGGAVSTLVPNTIYEITAGVYNSWNLPNFSFYPVAGAALPKLATPTGYSATALSSTSVRQALTAVSNATSYVFDIATDAGFTANVQTVTQSGIIKDWTGLTPDTTYYTRASAKAASGYDDSDFASAQVATPPAAVQLAAPTNGQATAASSSSLNVTFNNRTGATGYKLFRKPSSGGSFAQVGGTLATPSYLDTGLTPATSYDYQSQALGNGTTYLDSPMSNTFTGITDNAATVGPLTVYDASSAGAFPAGGAVNTDFAYEQIP